MTPNFSLADLTHTDHRKLDNTPDAAAKANLFRLAQLLEDVRTAIGDRPILINSAYRSKAVNDAVGSKDTSQHRLGCAADMRVPGMTPDEVVRAVMAAGLPFDQLIREFDRWTHISVPNLPYGSLRRQVLVIDRAGTRPFSQ